MKVKLAVYQFAPVFGEVQTNLVKIERALRGLEADLVVLPELCTTGYLFASREELERLAEPVPGPSTEFLQELAGRGGHHLVAGLAERERDGGRLFNSAALIGPEGVKAVYRKAHLFSEEKHLFEPGDTPFRVYDLGFARVGMLVCFDHFFPEAARVLALEGAQVIAHPANLVLPEVGQRITRVRALENRLFWALANRYGTETRRNPKKSLTFTGASQIIGPGGERLARAPRRGDALLTVAIAPQDADSKQVTPLNDLFEDRRPELYRLGLAEEARS